MAYSRITGIRPIGALHPEAQASRARAWADVPKYSLAAQVASTG
jgi:hypothetical protein